VMHSSIRLLQRLGTYLSGSDWGGSGSWHDASRLRAFLANAPILFVRVADNPLGAVAKHCADLRGLD